METIANVDMPLTNELPIRVTEAIANEDQIIRIASSRCIPLKIDLHPDVRGIPGSDRPDPGVANGSAVLISEQAPTRYSVFGR
jgi:hypothetical protein